MSSVAPHELFEAYLPEIRRVASRCGIGNVRVFGSVARGESGPASDIDFLVDLEPGRDLLDLRSPTARTSSTFARRTLKSLVDGSADSAMY
jgi:predicted nucleotidyltransferase